MSRILIIDDDDALRVGLAETIADLGHTPDEARDGAAGLALIDAARPDAVLLDLRMPGLDGMEVLRRIRTRDNPPPVAILTAVPTSANTIEAMRLGAFDHLAKPIGRDALARLLARMLPRKTEPAAEPSALPEDDLVGNSAAMRDVQKAIGLLADTDATVLITGETGTGKEVVARAIHQHGRRAGKPFIAVNCAAIPLDLLESQLFGHTRGSFTGATADRAGSFREAEGGTLFLDEIGDMPPPLQAKLLRVLQEKVVTPLGGRSVPIDVRILAATHQDIAVLVREGRFREDLYWRLGVVPVHLPPLRERLADIIPLAEHFLARASTPPRRLSAAAAARLLAHPWPGNVRELANAMQRAAAMSRHSVIDADDLAFLGATPALPVQDWLTGSLPVAVARLEIAMLRRALTEAKGNRAEAARRLGIHRQLLYEKLRRYDAELSDFRTDDVPNPDTTPPA
jgi:two-component system NtrC family response regulator